MSENSEVVVYLGNETIGIAEVYADRETGRVLWMSDYSLVGPLVEAGRLTFECVDYFLAEQVAINAGCTAVCARYGIR